MQLGVLGTLEVTREGRPVEISASGPRVLLARLVADAGRVVPMDQIVDGLWGDRPPASATKIVQTYVSQLRRWLEPEHPAGGWQLLRTAPDGYELAIPPGSVDALRFEEAVGLALDAPPGEAVRLLREALGWWRGPPYAGIDRAFAEREARRLEALHLRAQERCLEAELALGHHVEVLPELEALAEAHPLHERLAELLMLALYRAGRQSEALAVYQGMRVRLAEELGVDPDPRLSRLHEDILRHEPSLAPAGPVQPSTPSPPRARSLPAERSSFVGRERVVRDVAATVRQHRLVTLVGAGGVGKTRLAVRVAHQLETAFAEAWLVDLAALVDGGRIVEHALAQLGITDQMDRDAQETLESWIGEREALLVLDNCEHIIDAAAGLADGLLAACPGLRVLATSREPLRCPGERQVRIPSLGLPEDPSPEAVGRSEAGRLFIERAEAARAGFALDARTAPAVDQICRRLGGIPLAIELAAARTATMSVEELAAGLDDRFRLLTGGSRTGLPRHRTLLAATEWSYDLLTSAEQTLLCRLSVFVAGFDAEAAAEVCAAPPLEPRTVPALLGDLVDRSLADAWEVEGHTRYRLLETLRQYGLEQLGEETQSIERRYASWGAALAERVGVRCLVESLRWYRRLDLEFPHLRAIFTDALRRRDAETALRIAGGAGWAMVINGRYNHQRSWLTEALALARDVGLDGPVMAQGVLMAGALSGIDQHHDTAEGLLLEAAARFDELGATAGGIWARYWLAANAAEVGQLAAARQHVRQAADAAKAAGDRIVEAYCRASQAELAVLGAGPDGPASPALAEARAAYRRAQQLADREGLEEARARVAVGLALLLGADDPDTALRRCLDALEDWRRFGRGNRLILGLVAAARLAVRAGRPDEAESLAREGLELIRGIAWTAPLRAALEVFAVTAAASDPERSALLLGAAQARPPTHRWPVPLDLHPAEAQVAASLDERTATRLRAEGAALGFDAVIALALAGAPARTPQRV